MFKDRYKNQSFIACLPTRTSEMKPPAPEPRPRAGKRYFEVNDNLLGHMTVNEKEGYMQSRSVHNYGNDHTFDFEHSEKMIEEFKRDKNTRNPAPGFSKTFSNFKEFGWFDSYIPKRCKVRDSSPGMKYYGLPSGYSLLNRTVNKDFELSQDFSRKRRRPSEIQEQSLSSIF